MKPVASDLSRRRPGDVSPQALRAAHIDGDISGVRSLMSDADYADLVVCLNSALRLRLEICQAAIETLSSWPAAERKYTSARLQPARGEDEPLQREETLTARPGDWKKMSDIVTDVASDIHARRASVWLRLAAIGTNRSIRRTPTVRRDATPKPEAQDDPTIVASSPVSDTPAKPVATLEVSPKQARAIPAIHPGDRCLVRELLHQVRTCGRDYQEALKHLE